MGLLPDNEIAHAPGMPGPFLPPPWITDPDTCRDSRAVMHAEIANWQFPVKSVVGKTFPAFRAHAQLAILRIWYEAHALYAWLVTKSLELELWIGIQGLQILESRE